jgi:hypothetical protein
MAVTLTNKVARVVMATSGKGTTIFNDKLVDGSRSLKVWGWTRGEYFQAKQLLEQAGCQAELVEFVANKWGSIKKQIRLHVVEKG